MSVPRRTGQIFFLLGLGTLLVLVGAGCARNQPQLTVIGPVTMDSASTVRVTTPTGTTTTEVVGRAVRSPAQADFELQMAKVRLKIAELSLKREQAIAQGRVYGAYTGQYYGPGIYGGLYYGERPGSYRSYVPPRCCD